MELHPQVIEKEGKKEFVVLPYEEFKALEEVMHNYENLPISEKRKKNVRIKQACQLKKFFQI